MRRDKLNSDCKTVPFSEIANERILKAVKEARNFDISDNELFENDTIKNSKKND